MTDQDQLKTVNDFEFFDTLGEGSYSTVVLCKDKATGKEYAAKTLDKRHLVKEKKSKYVPVEKACLHLLQHDPFIVKVYYTFQDQQSLYFILELCEEGDLATQLRKLRRFSVPLLRFTLAQLVIALQGIHAKGIIHRDVKPENILLHRDGYIRLTDFGTAKLPPALLATTLPNAAAADGPDRANSFVGTAEFVSPELLQERDATVASDLWALGCIAYYLAVGTFPFRGPNDYQTFRMVMAGQVIFPPDLPPLVKSFISALLQVEPADRLGVTAAGGALAVDYAALKKHAFWGADFDWAALTAQTMAGPPAEAYAGPLFSPEVGEGLASGTLAPRESARSSPVPAKDHGLVALSNAVAATEAAPPTPRPASMGPPPLPPLPMDALLKGTMADAAMLRGERVCACARLQQYALAESTRMVPREARQFLWSGGQRWNDLPLPLSQSFEKNAVGRVTKRPAVVALSDLGRLWMGGLSHGDSRGNLLGSAANLLGSAANLMTGRDPELGELYDGWWVIVSARVDPGGDRIWVLAAAWEDAIEQTERALGGVRFVPDLTPETPLQWLVFKVPDGQSGTAQLWCEAFLWAQRQRTFLAEEEDRRAQAEVAE